MQQKKSLKAQMLTLIQTLHMTLYDRGNRRFLLDIIFTLCMGFYDIVITKNKSSVQYNI